VSEDAAREHVLWTGAETLGLIANLREIMSRDNYADETDINNQRLRYIDALVCISISFKRMGADDVGRYLANLSVALTDLGEGVTDPLFVTKGSKRDSVRTWGARLQAAIGLECLIRGGLPEKKAAAQAARQYKALGKLMRGNRDLPGSILSWRTRYLDGRVPIKSLVTLFTQRYRQIEAAHLSPQAYQELGKQWLASAVLSARQ
jgi:hypothetical protein